MYSVGLYTLGCKVSQYETEAVGEIFENIGFERRPFSDFCDVYVINTCTVTAESDAKSRKFIRRAVKQNPNAVVCVMGCYSQRSPDEVSSIDGVSLTIGTENKTSIPRMALEILEGKRGKHTEITDVTKATFEPMCIRQTQRTRAYVKIEDGCECRCTYCAIADARGRVRSKPPLQVIEEVEFLNTGGVREVVLTGIETASYGVDFDYEYGLSDLLSELDLRESCERIRLGSLAPELVGEKFAKSIRGLKTLAPHFHISVQSGSDNVLRRMKRRYNSETVLKNIERIRAYIPEAAFTTDLMVGFPGESEDDFRQTLELARQAKFIDAHVFAYSRRKGTPAADYDDQIAEEEKHRRSEILISEIERIKEEVLRQIVNSKKELRCILESGRGTVFRAHSDEFAEVLAEGSGFEQGDYVKVTPVSQKNGIIIGEITEKIKNKFEINGEKKNGKQQENNG